MWLFLIIPGVAMGTLFLIFLFGLLKAGRRADEGEDRIAQIISRANKTRGTESVIVGEASESLA
jgi:hypothetical protein